VSTSFPGGGSIPRFVFFPIESLFPGSFFFCSDQRSGYVPWKRRSRVWLFGIMSERSEPSSAGVGDASTSKKVETIDDMLLRLGIEEDEIDDLIFEDEETAPKEGIKRMALARVHTSNYFSLLTFEQHMRMAWSPAKEVILQDLEPNLFIIQCHCLGD
jgi:hypothetical protein